MVDRKKIQCSGTLASVTPMTSSTCGTCMGSTQSLVSSTPGGLKKTNSIQKGDNCLFQNPERDQNWIRMLELWTNFIKHLDPTPSDHLSEVLGNVSWTQVRSLFEREVEEVFQSQTFLMALRDASEPWSKSTSEMFGNLFPETEEKSPRSRGKRIRDYLVTTSVTTIVFLIYIW